jgi:hypothetical protein
VITKAGLTNLIEVITTAGLTVYRITAVMKVKTDTIASIVESLIVLVVILVVMYFETFTTGVIVFICNVYTGFDVTLTNNLQYRSQSVSSEIKRNTFIYKERSYNISYIGVTDSVIIVKMSVLTFMTAVILYVFACSVRDIEVWYWIWTNQRL